VHKVSLKNESESKMGDSILKQHWYSWSISFIFISFLLKFANNK
jgi:hypothetical protein